MSGFNIVGRWITPKVRFCSVGLVGRKARVSDGFLRDHEKEYLGEKNPMS